VARHAPRCAECGAPTRPQNAGGVPSLVCVACGATTVDPRGARVSPLGDPTAPPIRPGTPAPSAGLPDDLTLEEPVLSLEGLAALGEAGFESELEHLRSQRRRQLGILVLMGLSGVAFVVLVPAVVLAIGAARMMWESSDLQVPELPAVVEDAAPHDDPPEPDATPSPDEGAGDAPEDEVPDAADGDAGGDVDGPADEVVRPSDEVEPVAPVPVDPTPVDPAQVWIQKGWKVASREPGVAADSFRKALELSPGHSEASYGLGYCLLKQDDLPGAQQHLCVARRSSKADIRRDVDALLANNGLTCSP